MEEIKNIPTSIAIIMDGNRRWAKERMLPAKAGHQEGANAVRKVCKAASELGIKYLTLYARTNHELSCIKRLVLVRSLLSVGLSTYETTYL